MCPLSTLAARLITPPPPLGCHLPCGRAPCDKLGSSSVGGGACEGTHGRRRDGPTDIVGDSWRVREHVGEVLPTIYLGRSRRAAR